MIKNSAENGEVEIQINTIFKKCTPVKSPNKKYQPVVNGPNLNYVPETFPVVFCCALWWGKSAAVVMKRVRVFCHSQI